MDNHAFTVSNGDVGASGDTVTRRVNINRHLDTQQDFDNRFHAGPRPSKTVKQRAQGCRAGCECSPKCMKKFMKARLPFINIMKNYNIKTDLVNDLISGLTIGVMHIPQGMAYGLLAGLPPVVGLYTSFFPIMFYFLFGTSRHISLGTLAVVSLMVGNAVTSADCGGTEGISTVVYDDFTTGGPNISTSEAPSGGDDMFTDVELCQIGVAAAVTFLGAMFQIAMGALRLGFVTIYLSDSLTRGFMTGSAFHVFSSQVSSFFGISLDRFQGPLKLVYQYIDLFEKIDQINWASVIICLIAMVMLYLTKEYINPKVKAKIKMPVPIELIVVVIGTLASYFGEFDTKYCLDIVKEIPTGIPPPRFPDVGLFGNLIANAIVLAVVDFAIAISMASIFAKKHGYQIDANQELIALGLSNGLASTLNCFMAGASLSRSSVQEQAGGVTQLAGLISSTLLILVLFVLAPLFESLPKACLAAIIMVALKSLFLQFKDLPKLWKIDRIDFFIWVVVCLATVLLDVDLGLVVGVGFALVTVIFRTQRPYTCLLGQVPDTDIYKDVRVYKKTEEFPGIKIFRFDASLYFANQEHFYSKLYSKVGVNPKKLKLAINKANKKRKDEEKRMQKAGEDIEQADLAARFAPPKPEVHSIIIDCSMMAYLDAQGVTTLSTVITEYKDVGIDVYIAGCIAGVAQMLERASFYEKIERDTVFFGVHDAVLSILAGKNSNEKTIPRNTSIASQTRFDIMIASEQMYENASYASTDTLPSRMVYQNTNIVMINNTAL